MLNAFRQSKEFHGWSCFRSRLLGKGAQRLSAIKGISRFGFRISDLPLALVLNAFRQSKEFHRDHNDPRNERQSSAQRLSAIKGISQLLVGSLYWYLKSAQRLSAIKGISRDLIGFYRHGSF